MLAVGVTYGIGTNKGAKCLCEDQQRRADILLQASWDLNKGNFVLAILTSVCSNTLLLTRVRYRDTILSSRGVYCTIINCVPQYEFVIWRN